MISGSARAVLMAGVLIGLTVLGGIIGAGLDFVAGSQGWWMALGLIGLIAGASIDAVLIEGRRHPPAARTVLRTAARPH